MKAMMIKIVFVCTLLAVVSVKSCRAQADTLVRIQPQTARYFLQADDERLLLLKKDSASTALITNQQQELETMKRIVTTYKKDSVMYTLEEHLLYEEIEFNNREIAKLERSIRARKTFEAVLIAALITALIL